MLFFKFWVLIRNKGKKLPLGSNPNWAILICFTVGETSNGFETLITRMSLPNCLGLYCSCGSIKSIVLHFKFVIKSYLSDAIPIENIITNLNHYLLNNKTEDNANLSWVVSLLKSNFISWAPAITWKWEKKYFQVMS